MASASGFTHTVPLLQAAHAGLLQLVVLPRQTFFPRRQLKRCTKPTLLLIGDDDHASTGPDGWACAVAARDWCRRAILHGTGGTAPMYRKAVHDCLSAGRYVLVETSSKWLEEWTTLFATAPIQIDLVAPPNGAHPKPIQKRDIQ
jgi:hypothetical protein